MDFTSSQLSEAVSVHRWPVLQHAMELEQLAFNFISFSVYAFLWLFHSDDQILNEEAIKSYFG